MKEEWNYKALDEGDGIMMWQTNELSKICRIGDGAHLIIRFAECGGFKNASNL